MKRRHSSRLAEKADSKAKKDDEEHELRKVKAEPKVKDEPTEEDEEENQEDTNAPVKKEEKDEGDDNDEVKEEEKQPKKRLKKEPASSSAKRGFDYSLDFKNIDMRAHPELYRVGKGEQGVLSVEPYKSEILPHWRFRTPEIAAESADAILKLYNDYKSTNDFIGATLIHRTTLDD